MERLYSPASTNNLALKRRASFGRAAPPKGPVFQKFIGQQLSPSSLFSVHSMFSGVAVAGDDIDFLFFAFLVFHFDRAAVGRHDLHL
jgi:hypothetical protein